MKRSGRVVRNGELYLLNSHISPLPTTSAHVKAETDTHSQALLTCRRKTTKVIGKVERAGLYHSCRLNMHYSKGRLKARSRLGKGKRQFEKRAADADRDWKREQKPIAKAAASGSGLFRPG